MDAAIRWSPHTPHDAAEFLLLDILNSGLSLHQFVATDGGTVESKEIASYKKLSNFSAFDWSKTTARVISLGHVSGTASLLKLNLGSDTPETLVTYKAKQQRRCNTTALNTQNWLAVGLDKTRTDLSLNIYDAASTAIEPVRKLCPAEFISSVRFFTNQPQEVLAGSQRAFIRLYDLRDGFTTGPGNLQIPSRNVNNISIDPLDENYFAAGGSQDDPSVVVWDKRWLTNSTSNSDNGAVFEFRPAFNHTSRSSVWMMRYSGICRGRLALCSSTGELKVIDMLEDRTVSAAQPEQHIQNAPSGNSSFNRKRVRETRILEHPTVLQRNATPLTDRAIAFDWMSATDMEHSQGMLVLRASRTVNALQVLSHSAFAVSARSALGFGLRDIRYVDARTSVLREQCEGEETGPKGLAIVPSAATAVSNKSTIAAVLSSGDVHQWRCKQGYRFDCLKNATIVAGDSQLEHMWQSIEQLKVLAADNKMVYGSIDFSYVGINGLWSEHAGASPQRRLSPSPTKPSEAIIGLNESRSLPGFEGERTDYAEHRQICLAVCGWKFSQEDLEIECQGLIERGLHYQAIVQAVLHGARHLALNLLRTLIRGKTISNIGLGPLLAATELNEEQREMTLWMAADTEDPALKALLTYLHSGDWRDVMKISYLHLGYRLALGLKYLNDTELNGFIQSETARAIKNGDVEGVLLTGLTEQAMDLFQTYIAKTNDLQTPVLAMAFTNPLYVDDARWSMWKETYFMQMQAWHAFPERTRFTVGHNRLATTREGRSLIEVTVPAARLRCVHCQAKLGRSTDASARQAEQSRKSSMPSANAGIVCLKCKREMPRCSVCTLWLGAPDPRRGRAVVAKNKTAQSVEAMDKMLVFCTKCDHGSHAHHAKEWFSQYNICPVPDCACTCNKGAAGQGFSVADMWQASEIPGLGT
ncbi:hypothetical protein AMS68_001027 [Peltaster fructicola]|uniref:Uncharacterized protein n=1 Tax=Peltaster fructicola TaxID=286661 RepID=A0A6H0XLY2_9PEZI|nr:hypothetical protein AMS68_001027 [Peltaster fructicola]